MAASSRFHLAPILSRALEHSQLDGSVQGSHMACILCAALLDFGNPKALLWKALPARGDSEQATMRASRSAVRAGEPIQEDKHMHRCRR